jgi:hypothetical protein
MYIRGLKRVGAARKPSRALTLPIEWINALILKYGKPPDFVTIEFTDDKLILTPFYPPEEKQGA